MIIARKLRQFAIACVDTVLLILSLYAAMTLRFMAFPSFVYFISHLCFFIPLFVLWIVCFYTAGLYALDVPFTGYKIITAVSIVAVLCTVLGFGFFYIKANLSLTPKTLLTFHSVISTVVILVWRYFFNLIFVRYIPGTDVAFVNINDTVIELLENMRRFSYTRYNARCIFDPNFAGNECFGVPIYKDYTLFEEKVRELGIKIVIFSRSSGDPELIQDVLFRSLQNRLRFIDLPDFYESYLRRIPVSEITSIWFVQNINYKMKAVYGHVKRFVDMMLAVVLLILVLPFWPFIVLVIRLESPGPALFKQRRIGYLGKEFTIWKFRTMRDTGDQTAAQNCGASAPTAEEDPRVTKIGRFFRKCRIDEIPQIINVLHGEMSFIGPRPERPELAVELEKVIPHYRQRLLIKPGLSGWDQVSGEYHSPSVADTYKKLQYDLYYIKNMSLFLDVSIFFKTLVTIFKRAGV
jgi:exopolysaccharide biosynthesis polyprenyl glycosylphosphotransferase